MNIGYNYWVNEFANYEKDLKQSRENDYNQGYYEINHSIIFNKNKNLKSIELKIDELFSNQKLAILQSQEPEQIIDFFYEKEKECTFHIEDYFNEDQNLLNFLSEKLLYIFYHNPYICEKTQEIYFRLDEIDIHKISSEDSFYKELKKVFNNHVLPFFLIQPYLDKLNFLLLNTENSLKISTDQIKNYSDFKLLNEIYNNIRCGREKPFENIFCKSEIYHLFIIVNYEKVIKPYFKNILHKFLIPNLEKVEKMNVDLYYGCSNKDDIIKEEQNYFVKIDEYIKKNKDLIKIMVSLYIRLIHEFEYNESNSNKCGNIDNVYINVLLKNFIIYLDRHYYEKLLYENLFNLLKELYKLDIGYLMEQNKFSDTLKDYSFKEIDEILMQNEKRRKDYKNIKDELSNNQHKKENFMKTYWKKGWKLLGYDNTDEINKFIKHLSLKKLSSIKSNTITILIDGFRTQLREPYKQWEKLINALKSDTIFYFYRWPSGNFGYNMINHFSNTKERAKFSGKLLAHILESNQFLKGYQINLIGFSLGNQVIKYCLYELNRIKSKFTFKNVILIAAAIQLKEEATIKEIIENMIADKFINCYSKKDYVLNNFYIPATGQEYPVGLNELIIKNNENINLVNNYEFQSGHLDYNYEEVVKKICEKYNDI